MTVALARARPRRIVAGRAIEIMSPPGRSGRHVGCTPDVFCLTCHRAATRSGLTSRVPTARAARQPRAINAVRHISPASNHRVANVSTVPAGPHRGKPSADATGTRGTRRVSREGAPGSSASRRARPCETMRSLRAAAMPTSPSSSVRPVPQEQGDRRGGHARNGRSGCLSGPYRCRSKIQAFSLIVVTADPPSLGSDGRAPPRAAAPGAPRARSDLSKLGGPRRAGSRLRRLRRRRPRLVPVCAPLPDHRVLLLRRAAVPGSIGSAGFR